MNPLDVLREHVKVLDNALKQAYKVRDRINGELKDSDRLLNELESDKRACQEALKILNGEGA